MVNITYLKKRYSTLAKRKRYFKEKGKFWEVKKLQEAQGRLKVKIKSLRAKRNKE